MMQLSSSGRIVGLMLAGLLAFGQAAAESEDLVDLSKSGTSADLKSNEDFNRLPAGWTPLQFGVYRDVQFPSPWHRLYGIGLGLGTVESYSAVGLQAAIGASLTKHDMSGIQLGILASVSGEDANGLQGAVLASVAEDDMNGIQLGGIAAVAEGDASGIQASLLASVAEGDMSFLSLGGVASVSEGTMTGLQGSVIVAVAEEGMRGLQVGGIIAHGEDAGGVQVGGIIAHAGGNSGGIQGAIGLASSEGKYSGIEVAGIASVSEEVDGAQLAILHARGHVDGLQLALVNGLLPIKWSEESRLFPNAVHGVQVGGVNTFDEGSGIQAGILNLRQRTKNGNFEGWQLGGLNCAGNTGGLQLGLVNTSRSLNGVQIGLINIENGRIRCPLINLRFGSHRAEPDPAPVESPAP